MRRLCLFSRVILAAMLLITLFSAPRVMTGAGPRAPRAGITSLWLHGAGLRLATALPDAPRGYVYFGTDSGTIARVRLSDVSRDGTLAPGGPPTAAAIDEARGYAYFGIRLWDESAQFVKIRLDDFTIVMTMTLQVDDGHIGSLVLDETSGYAYLGTDTQPGRVVQVRLSDLMRLSTRTLAAGEDDLQAAVLDAEAGYVYFGTNTLPGRVVRVRLSDFAHVDTLALDAGDDYLISAALDASAGYAYFGTYTDPGRIVKVHLADMTAAGTQVLQTASARYSHVNGASLDASAGFAYFVTGQLDPTYPGDAGAGALVAVRLADFAWVGSARPPFTAAIGSAAFDWTNGMAYLGGSRWSCSNPWLTCLWDPASVTPVRLSDLAVLETYPIGEAFVTSAFDDGAGYGYFGTNSGQIVKVRLSDFTRVATLDLPYPYEYLSSGAIDSAGGYAYFGTDTAPGRIHRVRLSDFSDAGVLTLEPGDDHLTAAAIDEAGGYAYFGTRTGLVVKVRLADFARVGMLNLGIEVQSAVVEPAAHQAYFGLYDNTSGLTGIARIDLGSFAVTGSLAPCERIEAAAVIDPQDGFAYFGAMDCADLSGREVAKVRLSDFTFVGGLPLDHDYATSLGAAALDPAAGVIYWGYNECVFLGGERADECTNYGGFRAMRLADFAWADDARLSSPFPSAAVFDSASSTAIIGTFTQPGSLHRIFLGNTADLAVAGAAVPPGVPPGAEFTYRYTLTDNGPRAATGIVLTGTLPTGVAFHDASPGCVEAGGVVNCSAGDLRWSAGETITVAVTLDPSVPPGSTLASTATASAALEDGNPGNNTTAVMVAVLMPRVWLPIMER